MSDDAQLIESALAGDSGAFGQLVQRYQDRLLNMLWSMLGSREEAEDVAQDAFVQAFVHLDSFRRGSRFYTWLYRIAMNGAISRLRRRRPELSVDRAQQEYGEHPVSRDDPPEARAVQAEQVEQVRAAIGALGEDYRSVLVLREIEGLDYQRIAEVLELPVGTVRSRLHRARLQLRDVLRPILK